MYFLCCMRTGVSWIIESAWIFEFFIASVSRSHLTQSFFFPCSILLFLACFFFLKVTFNWRIIALQNRVGFCHVSTWVSHRYTYVASLLKLPLTPSHPSRLSQSTGLNSLSHVVNFCWLSVLHMVTYMFPAVLSVHPTVLPTLCPQVCSLCLCLQCCPANRFISLISLDCICMCSYIIVFLTLYKRLQFYPAY